MKEVGRKRINFDAVVTVEMTLKELQIIKDICNITTFDKVRNVWNTKNPPYTRTDKIKLKETACIILNSYR